MLSLCRLVLVVVLIGSVWGQWCVQPQTYWLGVPVIDWPQQLQQATLCGTPWHELMHLELMQLTVDEQTTYGVWLLFVHQTCAMALNQATLSLNITLPLSWQSLLAVSLDSLERGCANVSGWCARWQYDPNLMGMLRQMTAFNRGEILPQYPACEPPVAGPVNISYLPVFGNMSRSLFAIVLPTNETVWEGSTFFGKVSVQASQVKILLTVFLLGFVVLGLIVGVMFCMLQRNKKRTYHWQSNEPEEEETGALDPSDMLIELDGEVVATTVAATEERVTI